MPGQLFGYGRSDRSSKLIRGFESETPAGFRSRRGFGHDPAPVTPDNALFASYKTPRVHHASNKNARTRCNAWEPFTLCSAVFVATNFIVGRLTASVIASASRKSFFCPLEYGRTYFAGIRRASCPSICSLRLR